MKILFNTAANKEAGDGIQYNRVKSGSQTCVFTMRFEVSQRLSSVPNLVPHQVHPPIQTSVLAALISRSALLSNLCSLFQKLNTNN